MGQGGGQRCLGCFRCVQDYARWGWRGTETLPRVLATGAELDCFLIVRYGMRYDI